MRVYIAKIQIIRFKHVFKPDTALKARKYSNYIPSTIKAVLCTDTEAFYYLDFYKILP